VTQAVELEGLAQAVDNNWEMECIMQDVDKKLQQSIEIETALLKAMSKRENFETYADIINRKRVFEATDLLLNDYQKYFKLYNEHSQVDFELFYTQFCQSWHTTDLDDETIDYYRNYVFPAIEKAKDDEVESSLLGLIQKQTLDSIVNLAQQDFNPDKIDELVDRYRTKQSQIIREYDNDCYNIANIDFGVLNKQQGIPWCLPSLQAGLGSLVKGQFVVVSADYGAGKSAFVLSQAVEAFRYLHEKDIDRPILYFNSEGTEADVYARFLSNLYKDKVSAGFEAILDNIDRVKSAFNRVYDTNKFLVFQIASNNLAYLKSKIQKYNPSLVIIDICDVLAAEETPSLLKKLYDNLRLISGTYCPIIGTTQSGNTEYLDKETGKLKTVKWLGDKSLYGSKTGKGGAADTIITIGKDEANSAIRYINTPKKKRGIPVKVTCELEDIYSNYKEFSF